MSKKQVKKKAPKKAVKPAKKASPAKKGKSAKGAKSNKPKKAAKPVKKASKPAPKAAKKATKKVVSKKSTIKSKGKVIKAVKNAKKPVKPVKKSVKPSKPVKKKVAVKKAKPAPKKKVIVKKAVAKKPVKKAAPKGQAKPAKAAKPLKPLKKDKVVKEKVKPVKVLKEKPVKPAKPAKVEMPKPPKPPKPEKVRKSKKAKKDNDDEEPAIENDPLIEEIIRSTKKRQQQPKKPKIIQTFVNPMASLAVAPPVETGKKSAAAKKEPKGKFELEYVVRTSAGILYEFLTSPSGLSEWFADDVNIRDGIFTFFWDGSEQKARLLSFKDEKYIRMQWVDKQEGTYFEFRIDKDELTGDTSLVIIDFADEGSDLDTSKRLWDSQVNKLLHVIGSY